MEKQLLSGIGNYAFSRCINLTNIEIPSNITNIGENAFSNCTSLVNVNIPEEVTSIENYTFSNCSSLTNIELPSGITKIGEGAFSGCTNLLNINIPEGVTSIESHTFSNCSSLTDIELPSNITNIGESAFYECIALVNVEITKEALSSENSNTKVSNEEENQITTSNVIGNYAFFNCSSLVNIELPSTVTSIGDAAFENCIRLENITIPSGVIIIGNYAFSSCENLANVELPISITSIQSGAFSWCKSLSNIELPITVTSIGDSAFDGCTKLANINIPEGVEVIESFIFSDCINLTNITLPSTVTTIGEFAFARCTNLQNISIPSGLTTIKSEAFNSCKNLTSVELPSTVTSIGEFAFTGCSSLERINIPNSLTELENYTFSDCTSLINIELPSTVTRIGEFAFGSCTNLQNINIANGLIDIEMGAFNGCESLTYINIPGTVTRIGEIVFNGCTKLTEINVDASNKEYSSDNGVLFNKNKTELIRYPEAKEISDYTIPDGVTDIRKNSFLDCRNIENIILSEGVTTIGETAFGNCDNLKSVKLPNSVENIENYAFSNCINLESINIPEGVIYIGSGAFEICESITEINIPSSVTVIGDNAFWYCENLIEINVDENNEVYSSEKGVLFNKEKTEIICYPASKQDIEYTIPEGVLIIRNNVFSNSQYLQRVNISNGVTNIEMMAFESCKKLNYIDIPSTVTSIDYYAFGECKELIGFNVNDSNPQYTSEEGVLFNKKKTEIICYPASKQDIEYTIPEGIEIIRNGTFSYCKNLQSVNISNGVTLIDWTAFRACEKLSNVEISGTVSEISADSFWQCTKLENINVDESNKKFSSIDGVLFDKQNTKIICYPSAKENAEYEIPKGVVTIGSYAFNNCINLQKINIPEEVTVIEWYAFSDCKNLTNIEILSDIIQIDYEVFEGTIINKVTPKITDDILLPDIIKRAIDGNDILYSYEGLEYRNCSLSEDKTKIIVNEEVIGKEEISLTVKSGMLSGLNVLVLQSGTITYSTTGFTEGEVIATLHIAEGEKIINNNGKNNHTFTRNGEFTFEYVDVDGNTKTATARVENIDESNIVEVKSMEVTIAPGKTQYSAHESFDSTGMQVMITYTNGTKEETTEYTVINGDDLTCQDTKVEIQYNGNTEIKAEILINVSHDIIEATCLEPKKCKIEGCTYTEGEALGHSFTKYTSNNDATCTEDGTKIAKCDRCDETDTIDDEGSAKGHSYQNGKCTGCGKDEPKITITSEKYEISEGYITKITHKTTLKDLKASIATTNATEIFVSDKNNNTITESQMIGTGMTLTIKSQNETKTLKLVIAGDASGDGIADFKDIVAINRHRLNRKLLNGEYLKAGDVTGDGKADFKDIVKINRFRLNMITKLF